MHIQHPMIAQRRQTSPGQAVMDSFVEALADAPSMVRDYSLPAPPARYR